MSTFGEMFRRLIEAEGQSPAARTVELFGWVVLIEGAFMLIAPHFVASVLRLPELSGQAANFFRLAGLLASGIGMLYVVSGRTNAEGFVFASLLDRPLVPFAMLVMWSLGVIPGPLALAFSIQDFGGFLWTLAAWRGEAKKLTVA